MWSRMVCRSGGWLLLLTSLLISHHSDGAARRKRDTVYVADPAGFALSKPLNVPAKVGSPAVLIQPDKYEFYTFDESGELIKRLMSLEEIQEIIATGDGDDGHILTIAQSDVNKPAVTFNFQPPSHTKVHSIVSNVQNVLKSEMEAQKNNPPKEGMFDTPDVSSSWSQILPAIFGNTGGNIAPDSLISPHVGPETDFITIEQTDPNTSTFIDDIDKISSVEHTKENVAPIDIENFDNKQDSLILDNTFQSKTTLDESTKSSPIASESTTRVNVKTQSTPVRIQPTEKITISTNRPTPIRTQSTEKITTYTNHPTSVKVQNTEKISTKVSYQTPTRIQTTEKIATNPSTKIQNIATNKVTHPTTVKVHTTESTERIATNSVNNLIYSSVPSRITEKIPTTNGIRVTAASSNTPLSTANTKPTLLIFKQTTSSPEIQSTIYYKGTTKHPIKETEDFKNNPLDQDEKAVPVTYKPTNYIPIKQNTPVSKRPVNTEPSRPSTFQTTTTAIPNKYYSDEPERISTINVRQPISVNKPESVSRNPTTTPGQPQKLTFTPLFNPPKTSATQSSTEKLVATTETKLSTKDQPTKYTLGIVPSTERVPNETSKPHVNTRPHITINRNNTYNTATASTQHHFVSSTKPAAQETKLESSTITTLKPLQTSTENIEIQSTQSNKIQSTPEKEPEYTHVKISSSNQQTNPPVSTTEQKPKPQFTPPSLLTTVVQKITTEKNHLPSRPHIQDISSSTTFYPKPEIDINQIINQIVLDLGNSQQYEISTHRVFSHSPYSTSDEITTYRPSSQKRPEQVSTPRTYVDDLEDSATKKVYNISHILLATKNQPIKEEITSESVLKTTIKLTTEKISEGSDPDILTVTKPSYDLSESITNLISQIVNSKPTVVPVKEIYSQPTPLEEKEKSTSLAPSTTSTEEALQTTEIKKTSETIELTTEKQPITPTKNVETSTKNNHIQQTTEKRNTINHSFESDSTVRPVTQKTTIQFVKKPVNENVQSPNGHYITKVSSAIKPGQTTSKFEIYKTSNAPTTTTIKKILTPEISTQKTITKVSTPLLIEETTLETDDDDKPLKINLLNQNDPTKQDEYHYDQTDNSDFNDDTIYEGSETGVTHDDELMEMLNKYSEMFQSSPEVEAKSDESNNESSVPVYETKKVTSYKKTDIPEEEFYLHTKTSQAPVNEKNSNFKKVTEPLNVNTATKKLEESTPVQPQQTTEKQNLVDKINTTNVENKVNNKITVPEDVKTQTETKNTEIKVADVKNTIQESAAKIESTLPVRDENVKTVNESSKVEKETIETSSSTFPQVSEQVTLSTTPLVKIIQTEKTTTADRSTESLAITKSTEDSKASDSSPQKTETVQFITTETNTNNIKETSNKNSLNETLKQQVKEKDPEMKIDNGPHVNPNHKKTESDSKVNHLEEQISNVKPNGTNAWTLVSTASPHKENKTNTEITNSNADNYPQSYLIGQLHLNNDGEGLLKTTAGLSEDVYQFAGLCNELGFRYWKTIVSNGIDPKRSVFISPFAITSLLAMMFMATRGATSEEMNEILKLDDMVTFNPHIVFKNVTESIEVSKQAGVATSAIIRELYSDRSKGRLLSFYKDRVQKFYSGHVEEVNFGLIGDVVRRRTNLLVKRQTWSKIPEYIKHNNLLMRPPLAVFSANIFQTDCSSASTEGRDGEMYFVVSPTIRQRRLVPVPAVVYRSGFLAGYVTELDATVVAIGKNDQIVSTIMVMPGQQGSIARGDDIIDLEKRLMDTVLTDDTWKKLLKSLLPRQGLELQIPRLSHRSIINGTSSLQTLGVKDLFDPQKANLAGLNGQDNDLHVSDMILDNTFTTCGEGSVGDQHHIETYPGESNKLQRRLWRTPHRPLYPEEGMSESWDDLRDYQRAFHDPLHDMTLLSIPLHLRPRQARLPDPITEPPRLKFDRPFMYFVRHNPTGLILHMGRYNPRLLP